MSEPNPVNPPPYDLTDPEQRHQAAGEYVLNTLSEREKAAFEALMAYSHDLQADVQQWREHLQVLDSSLQPITPPARVWQNIEQQLAPKRTGPGLRFWQLTSMVSVSFALALTTVLLLKQPMLNASMADHLYVVKSERQQPAWLVNASMDRTHLMIQTLEPADVPTGKVCKLWLKVGDQYALIGTLPKSGISKMSVPKWLHPELLSARVVISMEPENKRYDPNLIGPVVDQGDFMAIKGSVRRF